MLTKGELEKMASYVNRTKTKVVINVDNAQERTLRKLDLCIGKGGKKHLSGAGNKYGL